MDHDQHPPPDTYPVTLGRGAWLAVVPKLYDHDQPTLRAMIDAAVPDQHGRLTLHLSEYMQFQVLPAIDEAVYDQLEKDQAL